MQRGFLWVSYNESGRRIGEHHPKARYTNRDVELVLSLRAQGLSIRQISEKMEIPYSTVARYLRGELRSQTVAHWEKMPCESGA